MIPDRLGVRATKSEIEMFRLIRDAPNSGAYFCLSSVGLASHERKDYGEADFIVVGPLGVFCIEVKGGEVRRTGGLWEIGWPGKSYVSAEGPFKQAQGSRWALSRELSHRLKLEFRKVAILGWGVAFPDINFGISDPEWSREVVYDQRDKANSFVRYLERLEKYSRSRIRQIGGVPPPELTAITVRRIVQALRPDFDLVSTLSIQIAESTRDLVALSAEQYKVLDYAFSEANPRLLCDGPAGSGKTLIACEAARRLANAGKKVLFVCFNKNLCRTLVRQHTASGSAVRVVSLHHFFEQTIVFGGLAGELAEVKRSVLQEALFRQIYPEMFERACELLLGDENFPEFDALVIDEGQDLLNGPVLNALSLIVNGGLNRGRWAIFLDSALQASVYGRMDDAVLGHLRRTGFSTMVLTENFRNPKSVVREVAAITSAPLSPCRRQFDAPVEYLTYGSNRSQEEVLVKTLRGLLSEGVRPEQVSVLSPLKDSDSCSQKIVNIMGNRISFLAQNANGAADVVTASSVSAFKGLENEVIVLTDVPDFPFASGWEESMLYVGMTRAKSRLFVLVDERFVAARYTSRH